MSAIITSKFRLDTTNKFVTSLAENQFYMALGRPNEWDDDTTPDIPYENDNTNMTLWENMFAMKKIDATDIVHSSPRNLWVSGTTYAEYDDQDTNLESKKYFVISDNNNVYLCMKAGGGTSSTNPDIIGVQTSGVHVTGSDGYIWKYMFTVPTVDVSKFLTSSFIPVRRIKVNPAGIPGSDTALTNQWSVQTTAVDGAIYNMKVTTAGIGYTSVPALTIVGDGTGATATAILSSDAPKVITGVRMDAGFGTPGAGYTHATVTIEAAGSTTAGVVRPVIGPQGGFGYDATNDLRSHYVTINKPFTGDESATIPDSNDFRQISLIKNPIELANQTVNHGSFLVGNFYKVLTLGNTTSPNNIAAGMKTESIGEVFKALTVGSGGSGMGTAAQVAEATAYNTCKRLDVAVGFNFASTPDLVIEATVTGAKGIVVEYDADNGIIYYMQNETTGFTAFDVGLGDDVKIENANISTAKNITAVVAPLINHNSGDIMFIENKTPTSRNTDQVETVRLVIAF